MEDFQGVKDFKQDSNGMSGKLCRTCRTCPTFEISKESDEVVLGGPEEGVTKWKKQAFHDFCELAKTGIFDQYMEDIK